MMIRTLGLLALLALLPAGIAAAEPNAETAAEPGTLKGHGLKLTFSVGHAAGVGTYVLDSAVAPAPASAPAPVAESPRPAPKRHARVAPRPRPIAEPPPEDHIALRAPTPAPAPWQQTFRDSVKDPGASLWGRFKAKARSLSRRILR